MVLGVTNFTRELSDHLAANSKTFSLHSKDKRGVALFTMFTPKFQAADTYQCSRLTSKFEHACTLAERNSWIIPGALEIPSSYFIGKFSRARVRLPCWSAFRAIDHRSRLPRRPLVYRASRYVYFVPSLERRRISLYPLLSFSRALPTPPPSLFFCPRGLGKPRNIVIIRGIFWLVGETR